MPAIRRVGAPLAAFALAAAASAAAMSPAAAAPVQDPIPVTPNTYFIGLVNGHSSNAIVKMACPVGAATGHPIGGQTVEVRTTSPVVPFGYTGSAANSIHAVFSPASVVANPPIVLTSFFAPAPIPTSFVLPCSGTGAVTFIPFPSSPTARSYTVSVTYANIAGG